MWPHSGPFLSILYGGSLRSVSSLIVLGPPDHFLCLLDGAPQICFFSYNMGAPLRSVSLFTIWDPPPPQISFFACYMRSLQISFCAYFLGAPLRSVFSLTIWGPSQISFSLIIWGPLRSVSSHTIWGAPQISFFAYYMGVP